MNVAIKSLSQCFDIKTITYLEKKDIESKIVLKIGGKTHNK